MIVVYAMEQKSAPVAVTVIGYITGHSATGGLLAIPCLIGQLAQIFIGSAFAPPLAKWVDAGVQQPRKASPRSGGGETLPPTPPQEMMDLEANRNFEPNRSVEANHDFEAKRDSDFQPKQEFEVDRESGPKQERGLEIIEVEPSCCMPMVYKTHYGAARAGVSTARQQETVDELEALEVGAGEYGWSAWWADIQGSRAGRESDETDGPSTDKWAVHEREAVHNWELNGAV
jgi:hypothetical protein